jgi:hypothetical protein
MIGEVVVEAEERPPLPPEIAGRQPYSIVEQAT